ncbi:MAG: hypothetical protein GY862_34285 [Gammaproteobacteria bacterium]|nr:hypothetical protein [Gammaproteobacteria bacterium]
MNKKTLMSAALLAGVQTTAKAAGGGVSEGGKEQLGVNMLTLEEVPLDNVKFCVPADSAKTGDFHVMPDGVSVVIAPFESSSLKMSFIVSDIVPSDQDKALILIYSQRLSPSPPILTPLSKIKLGLDLSTLEVAGIYNIPAQTMEAQPETRIGQANPSPRSKLGFDINLDMLKIPALMNNGQETIYAQAALLPRADFDIGSFGNMILSEVDTIRFVQNECPELGPDECGVDTRYMTYAPTASGSDSKSSSECSSADPTTK